MTDEALPGEPNVRGMLVLRQRDIMRTIAGGAVFERAMGQVPAAHLEAYQSMSFLSWVPQSTVRAATRAVAHALRQEPSMFAEEVVRQSVVEFCNGPWEILLRLTSEEALVARAASFFTRGFDRGEIRVVRHDQSGALIELRGWPHVDRTDARSILGGIRAVLGVAGKKLVVEMDDSRPPIVLYVLRHQP